MLTTLPEKPVVQFHIPLSRYWLLVLGILPLLIALGCLKFNFSSYEGLRDGYLKLYPCIYKYWEWDQAFFTRATCENGKRYCWAGIVVSLILAFLAFRKFKNSKASKSIDVRLFKVDAICLAILYAWAAGQWIYGFQTCYPAYDEVFSAVNCSGINSFQTASYYMLPNNHVFFNLINSFLGRDPNTRLLTGRILSAIAFAKLIPILYFWLKDKCNSAFFAMLFCALMLIQFPVWGFSFQARGYSFTLLCAWGSFVFLEKYLNTRSRPALWAHTLCVIIGLWTVPTFLFWEVALAVFFAGFMLRRRQFDLPGIKAQVLAGMVVFLAYLPVLCFSGSGAILENRYVVAQKIGLREYMPQFWGFIQSTIQYCFSGSVDAKSIVYLILFFLPLALLPFIRKLRAAPAIWFLLILWLVFASLSMYIQRAPFMRNLNAHVSFTFAALLLALFALMKKIIGQRWIWIQYSLVLLACVGFGVHFIKFNRDHIHDSMYFYEVDKRFQVLNEAAALIPGNARVWVSDEGFYWEFLVRRKGAQASMCFDRSNATHYIRMESEKMPPSLEGHVEKIRQVEEYEIFRVLQ